MPIKTDIGKSYRSEGVFKAMYQCAMDEVDELAETGDVEACVWVTAHNSVYTATEAAH
ncbi:MAG: hypothetical protein IKN25_04210 [Spirochaetales bacterium]|nr:hypothetical protein [Spirochaetales bacterium]